MASGKLRIGTSNVHLPGNKQTFPPEFQLTSRLRYYSSIFNTVEVNSCFYKTPLPSTYVKWALDVPDDFQFTLKLSKAVTHAKDLEGDLSCMDQFIHSAAGTGMKKGCILIQFPGKISLDHFSKVEEILVELDRLDENREWKKAVEFRNAGWYIRETWELLEEFEAIAVLHDHAKGKLIEPIKDHHFIYLRLHGPGGNYRGSYDDDFLKERASDIKEWLNQEKDVYVYFNNTAGNAFENALSLKKMLASQTLVSI